jgi:hypothetical protein
MRRSSRVMHWLVFALSIIPATSWVGCTRPAPSYIGVDGVALGRVVIYRNGVAYYERKATVVGDKLVVRVPRERVDDFLKSLKVTDVDSGETVAVTIPRDKSSSDGDLNMVLRLPTQSSAKSTATRTVNMTYVTEAPAWKPSYRVVVSANGSVDLEAWAIIDNTSGEDWKNVLVSVGSSSAMSFRYDLWRVQTVDRDLLASDERLAIAPPVGATPFQTTPNDSGTVIVNSAAPTIDASSTAQGITINKEYLSKVPIPGRSFESATQVAVSGSTSIENNYVVDGINSSSLALGNYYGYVEAVQTSRGRDPRLGGVEGIVSDQQGPQRGVKVEISGGTLRGPLFAKTDPKGRFHVDGLSPGSYDVKVSDRGATATLNGVNVQAGQIASIAPNVAASRASNASAEAIQLARWAALVPAWRKQGIALEVTATAATETAAIQIAAQTQAQLLAVGVGSEKIKTRTIVDATAVASAVVQPTNLTTATAAVATEAVIGDSHFTSPHPMTVAAGSSAMVAMLRGKTQGGEVYLYDPISTRGNALYAFRSVRMKNPSTSALEPGPVTVYGDGRFIGEGLTDAVAAGATTVVPFALDRQVIVQSKTTERDAMKKLISVERQGLWAQLDRQKVQTFTITNRGAATTLLLRHRSSNGYTLVKGPANDRTGPNSDGASNASDQSLGDSQLFDIELAANSTKTVDIIEATPKAEFFALDAPMVVNHLRELASNKEIDRSLLASVNDVLQTQNKLQSLDQRIEGLRGQNRELSERSAELNVQLLSLRAVRTTGELVQKLQQRMGDIADRKQKATIAIVEAQQQIMLLRLKLQDAYGGLRDATATKTVATSRLDPK